MFQSKKKIIKHNNNYFLSKKKGGAQNETNNMTVTNVEEIIKLTKTVTDRLKTGNINNLKTKCNNLITEYEQKKSQALNKIDESKQAYANKQFSVSEGEVTSLISTIRIAGLPKSLDDVEEPLNELIKQLEDRIKNIDTIKKSLQQSDLIKYIKSEQCNIPFFKGYKQVIGLASDPQNKNEYYSLSSITSKLETYLDRKYKEEVQKVVDLNDELLTKIVNYPEDKNIINILFNIPKNISNYYTYIENIKPLVDIISVLETHPDIKTNNNAGKTIFNDYFKKKSDFDDTFYDSVKNLQLLKQQELTLKNFKDLIDAISKAIENGPFIKQIGQEDSNLIIRNFNEEVLGGCRVFVMYRDDVNDDTIKGKLKTEDYKKVANSIIKKINPNDNGLTSQNIYMNNCICQKPLEGENLLAEGSSGNADNRVFGPFTDVFTEEEGTEYLFERGFKGNSNYVKTNTHKNTTNDGDLLQTIREGNSIVIFGFGFSGSGKTHQLISPKNKNGDKYGHILGRILEHFKSDIKNISLEVSELYPYVSGDVRVRADDVEINERLINDDKLAEEMKELFIKKPTWADAKIENSNDPSTGFIKLFDNYNRQITYLRTCKMRITPTTNNPESSRSHIFYKFKIIFRRTNKTGNLVIVDMAGTENTIQIKRDFLSITPETKSSSSNLSEHPKICGNIAGPEKPSDFIINPTDKENFNYIPDDVIKPTPEKPNTRENVFINKNRYFIRRIAIFITYMGIASNIHINELQFKSGKIETTTDSNILFPFGYEIKNPHTLLFTNNTDRILKSTSLPTEFNKIDKYLLYIFDPGIQTDREQIKKIKDEFYVEINQEYIFLQSQIFKLNKITSSDRLRPHYSEILLNIVHNLFTDLTQQFKSINDEKRSDIGIDKSLPLLHLGNIDADINEKVIKFYNEKIYNITFELNINNDKKTYLLDKDDETTFPNFTEYYCETYKSFTKYIKDKEKETNNQLFEIISEKLKPYIKGDFSITKLYVVFFTKKPSGDSSKDDINRNKKEIVNAFENKTVIPTLKRYIETSQNSKSKQKEPSINIDELIKNIQKELNTKKTKINNTNNKEVDYKKWKNLNNYIGFIITTIKKYFCNKNTGEQPNSIFDLLKDNNFNEEDIFTVIKEKKYVELDSNIFNILDNCITHEVLSNASHTPLQKYLSGGKNGGEQQLGMGEDTDAYILGKIHTDIVKIFDFKDSNDNKYGNMHTGDTTPGNLQTDVILGKQSIYNIINHSEDTCAAKYNIIHRYMHLIHTIFNKIIKKANTEQGIFYKNPIQIIMVLLFEKIKKKMFFNVQIDDTRKIFGDNRKNQVQLTPERFKNIGNDKKRRFFNRYVNYFYFAETPFKENGNLPTSVNYEKFIKFIRLKFSVIKLALYSFMMRYINIIVNQGKGVVATLEHLKFFFLNKSVRNKTTQIPKSLKTYDDKQNQAGKKRIEHSGLLTLTNQNDINFPQESSYPPPGGTEDINMNFIKTDPAINTWHYVNEDKSVGIKEIRQRGFFDEFHTLKILTNLANNTTIEDTDPDCAKLNPTMLDGNKVVLKEECNKNASASGVDDTDKNKYIMFAMINRGGGNDTQWTDNVPKRCRAAYETLDLASQLASEADSSLEEKKELYNSDPTLKAEGDGNCPTDNKQYKNTHNIPQDGGSIMKKSRKLNGNNYTTLRMNRRKRYVGGLQTHKNKKTKKNRY